ncbi:non-hydrolyzing UDP-N-acetylglucosamine 2-epimerase [Cupriavidus numazuensis]|uniref:UDP-2,3-diacetamido-2,3-dideoxy-D-glucuronate 2-epimerase n=1 Tax=Cupriavidus numazuensis TaxID=221992 RepID=A0ABN7PZ88_9BURK|nr:UDP-N-acetylglucosamine 2-epimerase (non-hydrolyzing) [Cupriavidus numazuensis]CAG2141830.1 UDP-2,3-diacetamido-2,3-dideoxy-D-glucuronate 2-epimerase [Cupriavidus numazuensis]
MKLLTIIGARPQFVKAAVTSRALAQVRPDINEVIVHTGQHYDANMSDVFFEELDIPRPRFNLGIGGGTHGQNTGRMIEAIEALLLEERPEQVLVYGDTDSTLAGALAAVKLHIPVGHVEAGLRSFNRAMPEEINRVLTDHVSERLFAPTQTAMANLSREGVDPARTILVGDVMFDAAMHYRERARQPGVAQSRYLEDAGFALCTIHRAENTDNHERLRAILDGLAALPLHVVLPLHPRTRARMQSAGIVAPDRVIVCDPVGYMEMLWLEMNCRIVLTDSGGVQKEAYFHGKPCVTLREETEWTELVEAGVNRLAGADAQRILSAYQALQSADMGTHRNLYGNGDAGECIARLL